MKNVAILAAVVSALMLGAIVGWLAKGNAARDDVRELLLVHELEMAGLCSGALNEFDKGEADTSHRLLYQRLETAIQQAHRLIQSGTDLPSGMPNIKEAARRSASYLETANSQYATRAATIANDVQ